MGGRSMSGIGQGLWDEIILLAKQHGIKKLILFGSRARGDFKKTSDIDLAVSGGETASFLLDIDEDTSTLLKYDIVDLDGYVEPELLDSIRREGVVIYEEI